MGLTIEDADMLEKGILGLRLQAPIKVVEAGLTGTMKEIAPEILATTRAFGEIKGLEQSEGRFLCDKDLENRRLVCVLGYQVAIA